MRRADGAQSVPYAQQKNRGQGALGEAVAINPPPHPPKSP